MNTRSQGPPPEDNTSADQTRSSPTTPSSRNSGSNNPPITPTRNPEMDELRRLVLSLSNQVTQLRQNSGRSLEEKLIKCLPKTKAPIYKGDSLQLDEFFHSIERYYILRGVDISKTENNRWLGEAIREHLEGSALKYYSDTNDNSSQKPTWIEVKDQLKKRFTVEDQASKDRQELMKIRQGNLSLEKFINKFLELNTRTARESELPEKWQIELFIMGLDNTNVTAHVKLQHDEKLTKVIQSAREADAIYNSRKDYTKEKASNPRKNTKEYKQKGKEFIKKKNCPKHPNAKHGPDDCWTLHPEKKPSNTTGNLKQQNNAAQAEETTPRGDDQMKELYEKLASVSEAITQSLNDQA